MKATPAAALAIACLASSAAAQERNRLEPEYRLYPFQDLASLPQIAAAYRERTQLPHIGFAPFGRHCGQVVVSIRRPTVVAGSFEAEDGSLGTIIVNATARPQPAKVRLAPSDRRVALLRADRSEEQRWDRCSSEVAVSLEEFGVRMLIVR